MEPLYTQNFEVTDIAVDCYGNMKTSMILFLAQEVAGRHCNQCRYLHLLHAGSAGSHHA